MTLPSSNLLYLSFIKTLVNCAGINRYVHFIDEEAEAGQGHTPGSAKVKTGSPTFFLQVQHSAYFLIYWHD